MVSAGRQFMFDSPWVVAAPGLAIAAVSLAFNLFGDALRDVLDPRDSIDHADGSNAKCVADTPMIDARNLRVDFATKRGAVEAVRGISFTLGREKLGIVGESRLRQVDDRARTS